MDSPIRFKDKFTCRGLAGEKERIVYITVTSLSSGGMLNLHCHNEYLSDGFLPQDLHPYLVSMPYERAVMLIEHGIWTRGIKSKEGSYGAQTASADSPPGAP